VHGGQLIVYAHVKRLLTLAVDGSDLFVKTLAYSQRP